MRVVHRVYAQLSRDTAQKQQLWFQDPTLSEVVADNFQRCTTGLAEVAVSSQENLSLGDVGDVRGVYLEVNAACRIRLNGSLDPLSMVPAAEGGLCKFFLEAAITQVSVENISTTVVLQAAYVVWGDPLPV